MCRGQVDCSCRGYDVRDGLRWLQGATPGLYAAHGPSTGRLATRLAGPPACRYTSLESLDAQTGRGRAQQAVYNKKKKKGSRAAGEGCMRVCDLATRYSDQFRG